MKWLPLAILLVLPMDIGRIAKTNRLVREAEQAYLNKNYPQAIAKYTVLVDSLQVKDERIVLNLANAYFRANQNENASPYYIRLLSSRDNSIRTTANQQMGLLAFEKQDMKMALNYFRASLLADPSNDDSRYNYELVKKLQHQQQQQQSQHQDQQQQGQQQQDSNKHDTPTEFARNARENAEILIGQGRYKEAYGLMQRALAADKTVSNYQEFINRIGDVAQIE